jgi:transposase
MAAKRYSEEFKAEAVKQVTERGYTGMAVADRLGVARKTLYGWLKEAGVDRTQRRAEKQGDLERENQRLKAELRRVEEERDILKKAAAYFAKTSG